MAGALSTIVFLPLLLSGKNNNPRSISTFSHLRCRISRSLAPVRINKRIAAAAWGPITVRRRSIFGACLAVGFVSSTS
jgi:hypothetical protein